MQKVINSDDLREHFNEVLDSLAAAGEPFLLARANGPEAALIPYEAFRRFESFEERTRNAIAELQQAISGRYPAAQFEVSHAADDPDIIHLITLVDVDDPDEVGDLVIDRVTELVAEERIPIHVIPVRTPERIRASLQEERTRRRPARSIRLLGDLKL
jgi:prevent-host-death family protein